MTQDEENVSKLVKYVQEQLKDLPSNQMGQDNINKLVKLVRGKIFEQKRH